ncbi:MAG: hypothetical protein WC699_16705 [Bacteroidales bacterium]|jgi:hypothetical protein
MSGLLQQKTLSKAFPVNLTILEIAGLAILGALAILVRAKLRVPLQLPGHHGLEVMALLLIGRKMSNIPTAASISTLVAALFTFFPFMGFNDPFLPVVYVIMGATIDLLYKLVRLFRENLIFFTLMGGLAYMVIPLSRIIIHFSGIRFYNNIARGGFWYPVWTHFLFGAGGAILAFAIVYGVRKLKK